MNTIYNIKTNCFKLKSNRVSLYELRQVIPDQNGEEQGKDLLIHIRFMVK